MGGSPTRLSPARSPRAGLFLLLLRVSVPLRMKFQFFDSESAAHEAAYSSFTMKRRTFLSTLLLSLFTLAPALQAANSDNAPADDARRTLTVTVIEPVERHPGNDEFYHRIARVFTDVFEARNWPVSIDVQRFGANQPELDLELRVFLQPIREESPGDLTFRAWMTLYDRGTKHDFGVITHRHYPRPGRNMTDVLDEVVRGAANEVSKKIETALFPTTASK